MPEHNVPLKVYKSDRRLTVAAAMPGVEPKDIHITLSGNGELTLQADERGAFKGIKDVILDEWNPGGYSRSLSLSEQVDASSADASYENGVLVVSLPLSSSFQPGKIELETTGRAEGKRSG